MIGGLRWGRTSAAEPKKILPVARVTGSLEHLCSIAKSRKRTLSHKYRTTLLLLYGGHWGHYAWKRQDSILGVSELEGLYKLYRP